MYCVEVRRDGRWTHLTTVRAESIGGRLESPQRTRQRAERMLSRWLTCYLVTRGEHAQLRLVPGD